MEGVYCMKRVMKNNLIRLVKLKKQYEKNKDTKILKEINDFIDNSVNKDKKYYSKLLSYKFDKETLKYLM